MVSIYAKKHDAWGIQESKTHGFLPLGNYTHENEKFKLLPCGSAIKNLPTNAGDFGSIAGSRRFPGEGTGNPLQYSCLGKSHGQRSLAGYSP